jgi:hypothetical protein
VLPKELGDLGLIALTRRRPQNETFKVRLIGNKLDRIQSKEHFGSDRADPLVAIDERMSLNEVVEIGGRHPVKVGMEVLVGHAEHLFDREKDRLDQS